MARRQGERGAPPDLVRLSKFMSLVLGHRAEAFGLAPDDEGFVPLATLQAVIARELRGEFGPADVAAVIERGAPRRFELRGAQVRASYGHSLQTAEPVAYPSVEPPAVLYHGTHGRALAGIRRDGLQSMGRQYVHLSATLERAEDVGGRRTSAPVILRVRALDAHQAGVVFHSPEPRHFLARAIPPAFIDFPESPC